MVNSLPISEGQMAAPPDLTQPPPEVLEPGQTENVPEIASSEMAQSLSQDTVDNISVNISEPISLSSTQPQQVLSDIVPPEQESSNSVEPVTMETNVTPEVTPVSMETESLQESAEIGESVTVSVSNTDVETRTSREPSEEVAPSIKSVDSVEIVKPAEPSVESDSASVPTPVETVVESSVIPEVEAEVAQPVPEITAKEVKKTKKKAKDFNKKELSGTEMDAFVDTTVCNGLFLVWC